MHDVTLGGAKWQPAQRVVNPNSPVTGVLVPEQRLPGSHSHNEGNGCFPKCFPGLPNFMSGASSCISGVSKFIPKCFSSEPSTIVDGRRPGTSPLRSAVRDLALDVALVVVGFSFLLLSGKSPKTRREI